ncbi:hypothetical protein IWQ62_005049 [Dispira parvispora]|uniref:Uncharacterized protein n=1 Tax=Dispira parvispora TaxID=1520584 RepID=A0A9W8AL72_9FUNG|nr:hypothetical protein IWQ62_005049 [Dispira parvispora]
MASYTIHDEPDLVEKVTGVSSIGEYRSVSRDIEALRYNSDTDPRHRALFEKALEWFDYDINEESDKLESRMYPQVKAFTYLIALYVRKKREQSGLPLKRYLLPHLKSNVKGGPTTRKRHDMVLRWLDPDPLSVPDGDRDTGVLEERDAFMEWMRVNDTTSHPATTAGSSQSAMGGYYNMNSKERNEDAIRERFWRCSGIIECKAQYNQNQRVRDYGQLGSGNSEVTEPVRAYVDPIPFKIQGGIFGRRTRCHKVWLTKSTGDSKGNKDNDVFVFKESWTELDDDPKKPSNMNTEFLPNEVRIFQEIKRRRGESKSQSIEYGLLTLEAGDYVRIIDDGSSDSGKFSTIARYCGDLDIVNMSYNV